MVILHDSHHASVDASDLGLKPGDFPVRLTVNVPERGEMAFVRAGCIFTRDQAVGYEYEGDGGFCLVVNND